MIKQFLHKVSSVALALLVMLSTLSVTVEKHYCGEKLVAVALYSDAQNCGMEMPEAMADSMKKRSCCKDTVDLIEGQDELKFNSMVDISFNQQNFITSFIYSYFLLFEGSSQKVIPEDDYSPPLLVYDIQLLDEVYLI